MKNLKFLLLILLMGVVFTGCADAVTVQECLPEDPYGFWSGLWHGMSAPFAWVGSLFSNDIAIYAINNNGGWYDFGYIIGIGGIGGGVTYRKR